MYLKCEWCDEILLSISFTIDVFSISIISQYSYRAQCLPNRAQNITTFDVFQYLPSPISSDSESLMYRPRITCQKNAELLRSFLACCKVLLPCLPLIPFYLHVRKASYKNLHSSLGILQKRKVLWKASPTCELVIMSSFAVFWFLGQMYLVDFVTDKVENKES